MSVKEISGEQTTYLVKQKDFPRSKLKISKYYLFRETKT